MRPPVAKAQPITAALSGLAVLQAGTGLPVPIGSHSTPESPSAGPETAVVFELSSQRELRTAQTSAVLPRGTLWDQLHVSNGLGLHNSHVVPLP